MEKEEGKVSYIYSVGGGGGRVLGSVSAREHVLVFPFTSKLLQKPPLPGMYNV